LGISVGDIAAAVPGDVWALGSHRTADASGYRHGVLLRYHDGKWDEFVIPRRPPANPFETTYDYMVLAYFLLLAIPLLSGLLVYCWRAPEGTIWRIWILRLVFLDALLFIVYWTILNSLSLFAPDTLAAIPGGIILAPFVIFLFAPVALMLAMIPMKDGPVRWR
jgi:hypothetical protein